MADVTVTAAGINEKDILDTLLVTAKTGLSQGLRIDPDTMSVHEGILF